MKTKKMTKRKTTRTRMMNDVFEEKSQRLDDAVGSTLFSICGHVGIGRNDKLLVG